MKYHLPEWQTSSPEALGGQTEQEMEEEIHNHDAKVVGGDGVELSLEDVADASWTGEISQDESSSEQGGRDDIHSSWVKFQTGSTSTPWPSPPASDDEEPSLPDTPSNIPRSGSNQSSEGGWRSPLKYFQSTFSSIVGTTSAPLVGSGSSQRQLDNPSSLSQIIPPTSPRLQGPVPMVQTPTPDTAANSPTTRHHRRTPSSQYPVHGALPLNGSSSNASGFLSIEPHEQAPPRPEVRRMTSHPDISSLCESWANTRSANQTVNFYKTSPSSFLKSMSMTPTPARPSGSAGITRSSGQEGKDTHQQHITRKPMSGIFLTPTSSQR